MTDSIAASVLAELANFDKMRRDNADLLAEVAELRAGLAVPEPIAVANARTEAALHALLKLVNRIERTGGHSWPPEQHDLAHAKAMLADAGLVVKEKRGEWVDR